MVVNAGIVSAVRGALLDISALPIPIVNNRYSKGNLTVKDLSEEYGVSTRTIYRKLTKSYKEELPNLLVRPVVVLMDTTYWGRNFGVVIMRIHCLVMYFGLSLSIGMNVLKTIRRA